MKLEVIMKKSVCFTLALTWAIGSSYLGAQGLQSTTLDGGSVATDLGYSIKVNKNSSLHRSWVVLNDPGCPVQLTGSGIVTAYGGRDYAYRQVGTFTASEPVAAFEVRYVLFDVFGEHMKTLSAVSVSDAAPGTPLPLSDVGSWRALENDVSELLTSVAFVAYVRNSEGKVWRYQDKAITNELAKIRLTAGAGVLDPSKEK
jgi:hypothetical protein